MRVAAFVLAAFAAFDWPLPWLDRAGAVSLALACAVLGVGRSRGGGRPTLMRPKGPAIFDGLPLEPIPPDLLPPPVRASVPDDDDGA